MNPQWRKINKRSGNIKRAWKKKYQEIVANNPLFCRSLFPRSIVSNILNITIYVKKINLKQANTKLIKRYER